MSSQLGHAIEGFRYCPAELDGRDQFELLGALRVVLAQAPLYTPAMPRTGKPLSARMSNCGSLGWVTDKAGGYRYQPTHPETGRRWPPIPSMLLDLWSRLAAGTPPPEACLINYYAGGTRMGSHVDADEQDRSVPVVSVSLGDDAVFHIGGLKRGDPKFRLVLHSGDVAVLGGTSRMAYHGIDRILPGTCDLLAEGGRFNLTLRRVMPAAI